MYKITLKIIIIAFYGEFLGSYIKKLDMKIQDF